MSTEGTLSEIQITQSEVNKNPLQSDPTTPSKPAVTPAAPPPYESVIVEADVVPAKHYSKEPYHLFYNGLGLRAGKANRNKFALAMGIDPNSKGSLGSRTYLFALFVSFLESIFHIIPYVGPLLKFFLELCCKGAITSHLIVNECERMGISEDLMPKNLDDLVVINTLYGREHNTMVSYGVNPMTSDQEADLLKLIRSKKDMFLGWKLTRLFKVGTKNSNLVKVPKFYAYCTGCPIMLKCWYGGSHEMARTTVAALKGAGVPYSEVIRALKHWKPTWAAHVRKLLVRALGHYLDRNVPKGSLPLMKKKPEADVESGRTASVDTPDSVPVDENATSNFETVN